MIDDANARMEKSNSLIPWRFWGAKEEFVGYYFYFNQDDNGKTLTFFLESELQGRLTQISNCMNMFDSSKYVEKYMKRMILIFNNGRTKTWT